jgi:RNA polymerase sigma-70 factor (family 1)
MSIEKSLSAIENGSGEPMEQVDLDALFKEFYDRLVYFSFQLIKNKDQAQDIAQDSFIKYWYQRETIMNNKIAIKNFLYATVRNASLNAIRHTKIVENYIQLHSANEPEDQPVIDAIITAEVMAGVHSAIRSLPESYRLISTMGYIDGKKNHEIADELAMSVNTVKKQKYKALQLLRMKLSPDLLVLVLALAVQILK